MTHVFYEALENLIWLSTRRTRGGLKTTRRLKSRPVMMLQKLKLHQSVSTPVYRNCAGRELRARVRRVRRLNSSADPLDFGNSFGGALDDIEGNSTSHPAAALLTSSSWSTSIQPKFQASSRIRRGRAAGQQESKSYGSAKLVSSSQTGTGQQRTRNGTDKANVST